MDRKFFLLDDNISDLKVASKVIEKENHVCISFTDATAGMKWLETNIPIAILLDLQMPVISGFELIPKIRKIPNLMHIPLIIMSGKNQSTDVIKAIMLGANDYIVKPIDPLVLLEKIKRLAKSESEEFAEVLLSDQNHKNAIIQQSIELISLSEFGVTALSNVAIQPNEVVKISALQKQIPELDEIVARCTQSDLLGQNKYKVQFTFVGITEPIRQKIRTFMRQVWVQANGRAS